MVKKTTNEELARMINKGFDDVTGRINNITAVMATKEDLQNVKSGLEGSLNKLEIKVDGLQNQVNRLEAGQSDIKDSLIPKLEFEDLTARVKYTELKLGIESGK